MANLNGSYDGGPQNEYRLNVMENSEPAGTFSGKFHNAITNKWESITGYFNFFTDRNETVLTFSTSGFNWKWEADFVNGSRSFNEWVARRTSNTNTNDTATMKFYKEI